MVKFRQYKHLLYLIVYLITYPQLGYSFGNTPTDNINTIVKSVIDAEDHPFVDPRSFLSFKEIVDSLYTSSQQGLLWLEEDNNENIISFFQLISKAKDNGLNKEHYNLSLLYSKWNEQINQQEVSLKNQALLDTAISFNLVHFLSDLQFGRIDPQTLQFNFKTQKHSFDYIPIILNALGKKKINSLSELVEPKIPGYQRLKKALLSYRNLNDTPDYNVLSYQSTIKPLDQIPQVIAIRQKLNILGISTNKNNSASCLYDEQLVDSIKEFQFIQGLKTDGIIGKRTIKALSPTAKQRIQQIELAMERMRWLPKVKPGPLVMVNIPAFQLWAYETEQLIDSQALNMKVIVGKSARRLKSPIFSANMYYLEFSPYWNIPKSITIKEIIPKLEEDPFYIDDQNMELVTGFHNNESPMPYTMNVIEQLKNSSLKLRQRPGNNNALGKVKFIFPNNYNVYLHDTPSRRLFSKSKRDLSHGCIRVEKPTELAEFLLKTKPGWNQQKILQSMRLNSPKQVRLNSAVPVIIFYSTAYPVEDKINFYEDIYGYDIKLSQALKKHHDSQIEKKVIHLTLPVPNTASINMNKI